MHRSAVSSLAATLVAVLASQHHLIHMALLWVGVGSAGMSAMSASAWVRRGMVVGALLFVAITLLLMRRRQQPAWVRWLNLGSSLATLVLVAWTIIERGW